MRRRSIVKQRNETPQPPKMHEAEPMKKKLGRPRKDKK
jgi:hypothetical protein